MTCSECPHCQPPPPWEKSTKYVGSPLRKYPKLWHFAKWSLKLFVLWLACSVSKPVIRKHEDGKYFQLADLAIHWPSDWQLRQPIRDKRIMLTFGLYVFIYLRNCFRGYSDFMSGFEKISGHVSGDTMMSWLKNEIEENYWGMSGYFREYYDIYSTKLQIAHFLANPDSYHGVVFFYKDGIFQSLYAMVLAYVFLVGSDANQEANVEATNPGYTLKPEWSGSISPDFVAFVYLVCLVQLACFSLPSGGQLGWHFGIRKFTRELRNGLGNVSGSFPRKERMSDWIEGFLKEEMFEAEDDFEYVEKCIDRIVKDISS